MTDHRSPPPAAQACLERPYSSSQKGGTLIAEDVFDLGTHEQRLQRPDRYRPARCESCGARLHIHGLRTRLMLGDPRLATEVIRFRCADRGRCGAVWQVLPAFLARRLWRTWSTVEAAVATPGQTSVPARTVERWCKRLSSAARALVVLLGETGKNAWTAVALAVGLDGTRRDLVARYAAVGEPETDRCLAELAVLIHRLAPGMRLM